MHNAIAANFTADLKAATSALNNDPNAMRKVFNEVYKVLLENFKTKIFFITPGCSTCEDVMMDKAYEKTAERIKFEFLQAKKYPGWGHLDDDLLRKAVDRLLYNIHHTLVYRAPVEIYIIRAQEGLTADSYFNTEWAGKCRYGIYVKVKQIDGEIEEFDLLKIYRFLEAN